MITFSREDIKKDPEVLGILFEELKKIHKPAEHTVKTLTANKDIKDFCEEATHFVITNMDSASPFYMSYDVASWYKQPDTPDGEARCIIRIDSITVYDTYMEYESTRARGMHSKPGSQTGVSLN